MSNQQDVGKIALALGLFASAIKSGESWSSTCEQVNREAHEALSRLSATQEPARFNGEAALAEWEGKT